MIYEVTEGKESVRVELHDVVEKPIEMRETAAFDGAGEKRCIAAAPDELARMPMDLRMEWVQYATSCAAPRWLIGFSAEITARWGLAKDTQYVEHYTFAWNYVQAE